VPLSTLGELLVRPALERAITRARVARVRERFEDAERVLILMQDDPDPDAIASALALKTLLGRTRTSAPLCTFGTITRPENLAMCKILEIEVEEIDAHALDQFDRVAMVDVQPSFLEEPIGEVDLVIDHHPVERPIKARMKDVRPNYGATSTILVEYLRAADVKISQRLATALLYGIKSDTLGLERGGTKADLDAFAYLYLLANHNALRRIDRPELSETALDVLAQGLARRRIVHEVFFSHLPCRGDRPRAPVRRLRPAGGRVEWSVVSGIVGAELTSPSGTSAMSGARARWRTTHRRPGLRGRPPDDGQGGDPPRPARRPRRRRRARTSGAGDPALPAGARGQRPGVARWSSSTCS
jgi:hypothetical protein